MKKEIVQMLRAALESSKGRIIILTEAAGLNIRQYPQFTYRIIIPEQEASYEFTQQVAEALKLKYSPKSLHFKSSMKVQGLKGELCIMLGMLPEQIKMDVITNGYNR